MSRCSGKPLATAVTPCERAISCSRSMAPATFVSATALPTPLPRRLAISGAGASHGRFRWRRGCWRSISRPRQPVSMLVLVGRLPILWWRSKLRGADLSKILGSGSFLLLLRVLVLCNVQGTSTPRSGPVYGRCNGRRQFGLLLVQGVLAGIEPRERSDRGDPDRAFPTRVMPPGKE